MGEYVELCSEAEAVRKFPPSRLVGRPPKRFTRDVDET